MIDPELLKLLCCPETHQELSVAEPGVIAGLNDQIAAHQLRNRVGRQIDVPLEAGLIRADGKWLYPVSKNVPILLIDESIPVVAAG